MQRKASESMSWELQHDHFKCFLTHSPGPGVHFAAVEKTKFVSIQKIGGEGFFSHKACAHSLSWRHVSIVTVLKILCEVHMYPNHIVIILPLIFYLVVNYHYQYQEIRGLGLIPCLADSQILLQLWARCIFSPVLLKLRYVAAWCRRVEGTPRTRGHSSTFTWGLKTKLQGQIWFVFVPTSLALLPLGKKRMCPFSFLHPFHPFNLSHPSDNSKSAVYIQRKFRVVMNSECFNLLMEIMYKLLLTWEGAQRGFVNAPVIISVEVFTFINFFLRTKQVWKKKWNLKGEIRTLTTWEI